MKLSKILRKKSSQSFTSITVETQQKSSKIWGKHSLVFSHTKAQFIHGLLALVQKKGNSLCESFEEDDHPQKAATAENRCKNDAKPNPFLIAKAKLLKQAESIETQISSSKDKSGLDHHLEEITHLQDRKTITWKQLQKLGKKKQKVVLRSLTDRK